MASEKTKARRAAERALEPRIRMLSAGPTAAELQPRVVSTNRRTRLHVEANLTRAQRMDLRQKRRDRLWLGMDPPQPEWAKPKKDIDVAELAEMLAQAETEEPIDMSAAEESA